MTIFLGSHVQGPDESPRHTPSAQIQRPVLCFWEEGRNQGDSSKQRRVVLQARSGARRRSDYSPGMGPKMAQHRWRLSDIENSTYRAIVTDTTDAYARGSR